MVALCALAAGAGCSRSGERPPPPNVLLVVLDTVRRDHLSTYGYPRETTPNLSALAASGARYDDVLSPAAWTVPSHATLMTGVAPAVHGAHHEHPVLDPGHATLAERFRDAGYRTAGFSANPFVGRPAKLDRGFDTFRRIDDGGHAVSAAALDFVRASPEPWFVFLNYMEAHMPYNGLPEEVRLRFMPGTPEALKLSPLQAQTDAHLYACGEKAPPPELLSTLVDLYDAALAHLDAIVGELLDGLGPWAERTVVVVVSDHGELLGEHGRVEHQWTLLEPLLRVPLIVRAPGRIEAGTIDDTPIDLADVHDLVLELAGVERGESEGEGEGDGRGKNRGEGAARRERLAEYHRPLRLLKGVGELDPKCAARLDRRLVTVQQGRWKLEWASDAGPRLYDLDADPGETTDVASEHPARVEQLVELALVRREIAESRGAGAPVPELEAEERARLRALGYLPGPDSEGQVDSGAQR